MVRGRSPARIFSATISSVREHTQQPSVDLFGVGTCPVSTAPTCLCQQLSFLTTQGRPGRVDGMGSSLNRQVRREAKRQCEELGIPRLNAVERVVGTTFGYWTVLSVKRIKGTNYLAQIRCIC